MQYLGDYAEDYATLNFKFSTHKSDGTPITLAGTPVVKVYKANSTTTESTAGVTLTVDFDGVTGLHNVLIDLSTDSFYAVANDYAVVITTGTVDSVSVVGTVLAHFSIENRHPVKIASDLVIVQSDLKSTLSDLKITDTAVDLCEDILRNKITVNDTTGAVTLYADNSTDVLLTGTVSDDSTTTTRTRLS
jgi:hypothetical protein